MAAATSWTKSRLLLRIFLAIAPSRTPGALLVDNTFAQLDRGLWIDPSCFGSVTRLRFLQDLVMSSGSISVFVPRQVNDMLRDPSRDDELTDFLVKVWGLDGDAVLEASSLRRDIVESLQLGEFPADQRADHRLSALRESLRAEAGEAAGIAYSLVAGSLASRLPILGFEASPSKLSVFLTGAKRGAISVINFGRKGDLRKREAIHSRLRRLPGPLGSYVPTAIDTAFWALVLPPTFFMPFIPIPGPAKVVIHL